MIEPIMYIGIGFLVAGLLVLGVIPLVHARAVRLTMRRLEALTPLSRAEIQADKDQLRAEFAMSTRRLEMTVEQLKARSTSQFGELGRKSDAIGRLKGDIDEKIAVIQALEAHQKALENHIQALEDHIHAAGQDITDKTTSIQENERALADKEAALARLAAELGESTMVSDSQQVEIAALGMQIEALKSELERAEKHVKDAEARLARVHGEADMATKELADERHKVENLGNRVTQLERQLVAQTTEAEILGRRLPRPTASTANRPIRSEPTMSGFRPSWRRSATSARSCSRTSPRCCATPRRAGLPDGRTTPSCASASTTSRPRSPGSPWRSKARIPRSNPFLRPNLPMNRLAATSPTVSGHCKAEPRASLPRPDVLRQQGSRHAAATVEAAAPTGHDGCRAARGLGHEPDDCIATAALFGLRRGREAHRRHYRDPLPRRA